MTWRVKGKAVSPDQRQYLMSLPLCQPAKKRFNTKFRAGYRRIDLKPKIFGYKLIFKLCYELSFVASSHGTKKYMMVHVYFIQPLQPLVTRYLIVRVKVFNKFS